MVDPLKGVKVIELGQGVAAPFCTMMLGDLGAEVVKVEPPGGDLARQWGPPYSGKDSAYFVSINRNKKSVVLDLKKGEGRKVLLELCRGSDVLVENFRPGVASRLGCGYGDVRRANPGIVYCSISGYGQRGPSRGDPAFDIVVQARGGLMDVTGEPGGGPVKVGVPITDMGAGMYSAYAIAAALLRKRETGKGGWVDVSLLDTAVSWLSYWITGYGGITRTGRRMGSSHPTIVPYQLFRAKDGFVAVAASTDRQWRGLCTAVGREDLLNDPRFDRNSGRVANRKRLNSALAPTLRAKPRRWLLEALSKEEVPCGPFQTVDEVLDDPQVAFRGMLVGIDHASGTRVIVPGSPLRFSSSRRRSPTSPPLLGQHSVEVLKGLGYKKREISRLTAQAVVA